MNGDSPTSSWSISLQHQVRLLHQQIASMQNLVTTSGGQAEMLEKACASYYRLLDDIYQRDMPVARALDVSDLLLHVKGSGLQTRQPRLSLVTGILSDVRQQVGGMIKTLVGSFHENVELPRDVELGLNSLAQGSLFLGFNLPEPDAGFVALQDDPFFTASRQALTTLGAVTCHIEQPDAYDLIQEEFADPKLRDAALSAVGQLAPSGRRGVSSLSIGGRALRPGAWPTLTPQTRLQIRAWLERPLRPQATLQITGRVRAIDLDLRRFDLRRLDAGTSPDLRCIYPATLDGQATKWLNATLKVSGQAELFQGIPRLLQIENVEQTGS